MTQRDGMGREVGGVFRLVNTCKSMADSCQCMAKTTTILCQPPTHRNKWQKKRLEKKIKITTGTLAEDLRQLKGNRIFEYPFSMKERIREKEGKRKWDGTCAPWHGSWRRREVPISRETLSPVGKSVGTGRELQRLLEESTSTGLWQAGQSETYTNGPCHSPVYPSMRHVSADANGN